MFQTTVESVSGGFFSLFISGLERQNPEALLEVEQENLRRQIGQYNQGLATHAGLCERLISQVRQLENEQRDLRARTDGKPCVPAIAKLLPSLRCACRPSTVSWTRTADNWNRPRRRTRTWSRLVTSPSMPRGRRWNR